MASKVDTSDPAVRRLVYNHYRGILGKYNERANNIVSQLPKERVVEDKGITRQLESMVRQSNQIQSNGNSNTAPGNGAPPPPPPPAVGSIPSVRIASEIGSKKSYEPPAAIQNAMMTKDKKPFTYTPGGLNLNEIRSPRMARRISRNAHTEDSCTGQIPQQNPMSSQPLPPAAVAAMQPQIAVAVLPPPPPPPPPPPAGPCPPSSAPPAPTLPPPTSPSNKPLDFPPRPEFLADIASHPPLRPVGQAPRSSYEAQPPEFLADIASHPPLRPVGQAPRSSYEPQPSSIQVQLKPVSPKPSVDQIDSAPIGQVPFVPRPQVEIPIQNLSIAGQGVSPPIQNQVRSPLPQAGRSPVTPPTQQIRAPPTPPLQSVRTPPTPPVQSVKVSPVPMVQPATPPAPTPPPIQRQPSTPSTPSLNKSPAPWLTNKAAPKEVQPSWAMRQQSLEPQPPMPPVQQPLQQPIQTPGHQPVTRVIPIQIEGRQPATPPTPMQQFVQTPLRQTQPQSPDFSAPHQHHQQPSPTFMQTQPQYPQYPPLQQQYTYPQQQYVPPQFQQYGQNPPQQQYVQSQPVQQDVQGRTRIIPIQMEGNGNDNQQQTSQKAVYQNQTSLPGNIQNRNQNGEADPRKFQTQTSWSGNPTQSRSFRVLQKITGSDDEPQAPLQQVPHGEVILVNRVYPAQATEPVSREYSGWGTNTPPVYPNYWYNPPQTPEEQQQFWEHYNAMCNYMAHMNATAMRYSPYPFPPYLPPYMPYPSDTEDYSNSSSDEMTIYGNMFKEHAQQMEQQAQNQSMESITESSDATPADLTETEGEDTSDTDTEVEERSQNPIPSIRSVPNINIYACNSDESSEDSESEEDDEGEETEDDSLPHQLSVIYEESDFSSEEGRKSSAKSPYESDNSSSSTLKNKDEDENAVKVRLPLQLKFTRSENDEEVATLIVGNSEMEASKTNETEELGLIITDIIKEESDPDISATIILKKPKAKGLTKEREDSPVDFWKELNGDNNVSTNVDVRSSEDDSKQEESDFHWEDDSSSTSVQTVKKGVSGNDSSSEAEAAGNLDDQEELINNTAKEKSASNQVNSEDTCESDESSEEEETDEKASSKIGKEQLETEEEEEEEEDSDSSSSSSSSDDDSEHSNVFNENTGEENCLAKKKELINSKSFEESEDDSGVTSDLSRHISETDTDPECGSELSKMSRYQRAATHSRLFKLLQEECEAEDNAERSQSISQRKERLTLPLNNTAGGEDSLSSSSGINSPSSPTVNDRLVKELIQSLLSRKKGRHFRKLPIEKLHAAALRILQEDMDRYDSLSTSDESNLFLSPVNNSKINAGTYTDSSLLNPESYGGNYYDYCDYYSTWGTVDSCVEPEYDVVPSKTFKTLQRQVQGETPGIKVRCPRVPSSKNVREQLTTPIPSFSSPIPKET
ncbi:protein piccolo [Halyomorpha halys]|uniref:protein piccolo n=1 Tax=Halyomorpha halys TaxID=286706 RepID=UPI0006D4E4CD